MHVCDSLHAGKTAMLWTWAVVWDRDIHLVQQLHILQEVSAALHVCDGLAHRHWQAQVCYLQGNGSRLQFSGVKWSTNA